MVNHATRQPIKVVYVIDDLGLGGAQRQLVELLKGLPRQRYDARVISLSTTKTDYAGAIRAIGIPLEQIPQSGTWDWRCFVTLWRRLRQERPAIVHTWLFTAELYGRLAAWLTGVPVIMSAIRSIEPDKPAHYVAVDRLLRHVTRAFTVNANAIGDVLASRERVARAKIHTVYNGIDLSVFNPSRVNGMMRARLRVDAGTPLIGIVGRLAPVKDHATFLRVAALVAAQRPDAQFLIVGSGPLQPSLEALANTLGIGSQVRFIGSTQNAAEAFAALDVLVVSSIYEGCCNVILEGMAMGKPVVATAVGGNPELVLDGQTGLLVPSQDPQRLAEALLQLMRDPQRAQTMGRSGRHRVEERFSLPQMVQHTAALYEQELRK